MCNTSTKTPTGPEKTNEESSQERVTQDASKSGDFRWHTRSSSTYTTTSSSSSQDGNKDKAGECSSTPKRKKSVDEGEVVREIVIVRRRVIRWAVTFEFEGEPDAKRQKVEEVDFDEDSDSDSYSGVLLEDSGDEDWGLEITER
ncbi:hypothetical protein FRC12_013128 [Ceratobasidium sp. 428]|nr:hypothetical protein FRC12_013128 [Ceratobasidium sp. 428]